MIISSIAIENFKRIKKIDVTLADVTVLIGGNNSGKTSLLQGIHLAITALQAARSASISSSKPLTTLGVDQLLYKPSSDPMKLNHDIEMTSKTGPEITFTYNVSLSSEPANFKIAMRRGKNANISITFDHKNSFYDRASDRTRPLSIFVPGLAGVALREEYRTDAIVTTGIAQGDANMYLRNVLLRLIRDDAKLAKFHAVIGDIFPGSKISVNFDQSLHQTIEIIVDTDKHSVPLELVGTGTLQAIQLVAYATMYDPGLLLLDEPDAHLHPSNQRILATTLLKIAEQGTARIILATHSRHIFHALTRSNMTDVIWLKEGSRQERRQAEDLSILLDLGALDSYELLRSGQCKVIVLTEDSKYQRLDTILKYNGFKQDQYMIQPFHGVSNITMCIALADFFLKQGDDTYVLVHRDSDCLLPDEMEWYQDKEQAKLPVRCKHFLTPLTDIEHQFCQATHISEALGIKGEEAEEILKAIISANAAKLAVEYAQKRQELKSKILKDKIGVPNATDLVNETIDFAKCKGKSLWGLLNLELIRRQYNPMHLLTKSTRALEVPALRKFSNQFWPK